MQNINELPGLYKQWKRKSRKINKKGEVKHLKIAYFSDAVFGPLSMNLLEQIPGSGGGYKDGVDISKDAITEYTMYNGHPHSAGSSCSLDAFLMLVDDPSIATSDAIRITQNIISQYGLEAYLELVRVASVIKGRTMMGED